MEKEEVLQVGFGEDGGFSVTFSDGFLDSSIEDQIQALEEFYREKSVEANSIEDISYNLGEREQTLMLAEAFLGRLKRGNRIQKDTDLEISLEEIIYPTTRVPLV